MKSAYWILGSLGALYALYKPSPKKGGAVTIELKTSAGAPPDPQKNVPTVKVRPQQPARVDVSAQRARIEEDQRKARQNAEAKKAAELAKKKAKTKPSGQAKRGVVFTFQEAGNAQKFFGLMPLGSLAKILEENSKTFFSVRVTAQKVKSGSVQSYTGKITNASKEDQLKYIGQEVSFRPSQVFGMPGLAQETSPLVNAVSAPISAKKGREIGLGLFLEPRSGDFSSSLTSLDIGNTVTLFVQNPKVDEPNEVIEAQIVKFTENAKKPQNSEVQATVTKAPGFTSKLLGKVVSFSRGDIGTSF